MCWPGADIPVDKETPEAVVGVGVLEPIFSISLVLGGKSGTFSESLTLVAQQLPHRAQLHQRNGGSKPGGEPPGDIPIDPGGCGGADESRPPNQILPRTNAPTHYPEAEGQGQGVPEKVTNRPDEIPGSTTVAAVASPHVLTFAQIIPEVPAIRHLAGIPEALHEEVESLAEAVVIWDFQKFVGEEKEQERGVNEDPYGVEEDFVEVTPVPGEEVHDEGEERMESPRRGPGRQATQSPSG